MPEATGITLTPAAVTDFPTLRDLAGTIWRRHYAGIVSAEQIDYMLARRFSDEALQAWVGGTDRWLEMLRVDGAPVGYCSSEAEAEHPEALTLRQLYLLESHRGRGLGRFMLGHVENRARTLGKSVIRLQVNKRNATAIAFYRAAGFSVREAAVFDIGAGFVMDDFVMEKRLQPAEATSRQPPRGRSFGRALLLRCPRCGVGPLFRGPFRMNDGCGACGLSFRREPGFYLGSIYVNYGVTVIVTGLLYGGLVLGAGWSHEAALAVCLVMAVLLPILLFRHARGFLLALDGSVNAHQSGATGAGVMPGAHDADGVHLAGLAADDGRAGCMMGIVLVLIVLFGIIMALVTIWFAGGLSGGSRPAADAVDLAARWPAG